MFYTNRTSTKAQDLAGNPHASALFPWYALHRQVIIHGPVTPMSQAESEPYFHSRPRGSQIGAWGEQAVVGDRVPGRDRGRVRTTGAAVAGGHGGQCPISGADTG